MVIDADGTNSGGTVKTASQQQRKKKNRNQLMQAVYMRLTKKEENLPGADCGRDFVRTQMVVRMQRLPSTPSKVFFFFLIISLPSPASTTICVRMQCILTQSCPPPSASLTVLVYRLDATHLYATSCLHAMHTPAIVTTHPCICTHTVQRLGLV